MILREGIDEVYRRSYDSVSRCTKGGVPASTQESLRWYGGMIMVRDTLGILFRHRFERYIPIRRSAKPLLLFPSMAHGGTATFVNLQ